MNIGDLRTAIGFVLFITVLLAGTELLFRWLRAHALPKEETWMEPEPNQPGQTADPPKITMLMVTGAQMRVGRKLGRTLYLRDPKAESFESDLCVGIVDTPELANRIVELWNEKVAD